MPPAHLHPQSFSVLVTCALGMVAVVYSRGWWRIRNASPSGIPVWRAVVFIGGLSLLWIAVGSPFSGLDHRSLTVHMINHLVLMLAAAPLVLAGAPAGPLLRGLPAGSGHGFQNSLHSSPAQWLSDLFMHPVCCWFFAAGAVIGWHVPAVFQLALGSPMWHGIEYATFILAGLLFWRPVMRPEVRWPRWLIPLYLFLATLPCDILSAFLVFCDRLVYPSYASVPGLFNLSPLQDQQCAAALMWVSVTIAYLLPAAGITVKILSPVPAYPQLQVQRRVPTQTG